MDTSGVRISSNTIGRKVSFCHNKSLSIHINTEAKNSAMIRKIPFVGFYKRTLNNMMIHYLDEM